MTAARAQVPAALVLQVEGLTIAAGGTRLVEDFSLAIEPGEMVALVGESGSGKTITALALLRLLPPPVRIETGTIEIDAISVRGLDGKGLQALRGDRAAMIFQEPMTSLNPVFTIGEQIAEAIRLHRPVSQHAAMERATALLDKVGIAAATSQLKRYPHQLSGGQRQRVMIAMALACEPRLLIADEPTTALDVTVQAEILALIDRLRRDLGMACLLITHDLGVVGEFCDRAAVMYAGRIVETARVGDLFLHPRHRYTCALIETMPANNPPGRRLPAIAGLVPPPQARGNACAFAPRCKFALDVCARERPVLSGTNGHEFACWNPAA